MSGYSAVRIRKTAAPVKAVEALYLLGLLVADLLLELIIRLRVPFSIPLPEYYYPAIELATKHRIASDFLSIGYPALLGLGFRITGSNGGMSLVNWVISFLVVIAAWAFLRQLRVSVKRTLVLCTALCCYPDFLFSYSKVQEANLTALILFGFLTLTLALLPTPKPGIIDTSLAILLGMAILVRPNLVLLIPISWIVMWRVGTTYKAARIAAQVLIVTVCYVFITAAVHGRPFVPQNGPYNLFSGANRFTIDHIDNPEDSLVQAIGEHGVHAGIFWSQPPDTPGVNDLRDSQYKRSYTRWAGEFIYSHPGLMVELSGLKLVNLLRPDLKIHKANTIGGMVKILECVVAPLWLIVFLASAHPGPGAAKLLVTLVVIFYVLPFVLTVSAPRFLIPLDLVLLMDLGAMTAPVEVTTEAPVVEEKL